MVESAGLGDVLCVGKNNMEEMEESRTDVDMTFTEAGRREGKQIIGNVGNSSWGLFSSAGHVRTTGGVKLETGRGWECVRHGELQACAMGHSMGC